MSQTEETVETEGDGYIFFFYCSTGVMVDWSYSKVQHSNQDNQLHITQFASPDKTVWKISHGWEISNQNDSPL